MVDESITFGLAPHLYADFAEIFARYPQIEEVLIFGSRATGAAKPWSDFDLAVVAPTLNDAEFTRLWHELDELPLVFKLDVLHFDRLAPGALKTKIRQQGRCFYPPLAAAVSEAQKKL